MTKDRSFASALHILAALAHNDGERMSSEMLAYGMRTNPGLVRRLLSKLAKAGLVETEKGKNGGVRLAKKPNAITLKEVYLALEPDPLFRSFDKEPVKECQVSCGMNQALCSLFGELEQSLIDEMSRLRLSKLIERL